MDEWETERKEERAIYESLWDLGKKLLRNDPGNLMIKDRI
jgi:hypothetical protein